MIPWTTRLSMMGKGSERGRKEGREGEGGRKNTLGPNTRVLPRNVLPNGAQCKRQICNSLLTYLPLLSGKPDQ